MGCAFSSCAEEVQRPASSSAAQRPQHSSRMSSVADIPPNPLTACDKHHPTCRVEQCSALDISGTCLTRTTKSRDLTKVQSSGENGGRAQLFAGATRCGHPPVSPIPAAAPDVGKQVRFTTENYRPKRSHAPPAAPFAEASCRRRYLPLSVECGSSAVDNVPHALAPLGTSFVNSSPSMGSSDFTGDELSQTANTTDHNAVLQLYLGNVGILAGSGNMQAV